MKNTIFIVGVGRSGTSLLQSILNAHTELAFLPETQFFRKYVAAAAYRKNEGKIAAAAFGKILKTDEAFQRAGIQVEDLMSNMDGTTFRTAEAYKVLLQLYLKGKNKKIIGDKDPRNIDYLPQLHQHFPESKIIHIYRDPRDVILSKTKAAWSAHRPLWQHTLIGQYQLARGRRLGKQLYGDQFFEIQYEQLINEPEQLLRNLTAFLGLAYEPGMMNFANSSRELVDEKEMSWKKETFKPILKGNSGKWKENFSQKQIQFVETVSKEAFQTLHYEKTKPKAPVLTRLLASIGNALFPVLYQRRL